MKKLQEIFRAGTYPQGTVTNADLKEIAASYNPAYHEAPLTFDHNQSGPAHGWVESLIAEGSRLMASFKDLSSSAIDSTKSKQYKRTSPEIALYNGKKYLRAVSLVNFPAAKGMPAIEFKEDNCIAFFSELLPTWNATNSFCNFDKPNFNKPNMNEPFLTFAEAIGIDISVYKDDLSVLNRASEIIRELRTELKKYSDSGLTVESYADYKTSAEARNEALKTENASLVAKLVELNKAGTVAYVESLITSGKLLPAQKDSFLAYCEKDLESAKKFAESLPVMSFLDGKRVPSKQPDGKDPKFYNEDGTRITYAEILKDMSRAKLFTEEELSAMRAEYIK